MIRKNVKLNGKDQGVAVIISKNPKTGAYNFFKDKKTDQIKLFLNIEMAKSISDKQLSNVANRQFCFILADKKMIMLDECQKVGNSYQYSYQYIEDDSVYYIKEDYTAKVTSIGYLTFYDGDTVRCDKAEGANKNKQLFSEVRNEIMQLFRENIKGYGIKNIFSKYREYVIKPQDTSCRIHILQVSQMMSINQLRKEKGERVLIFNKDMDKFTTFYVYITKMTDEPKYIDSDTLGNKIIELMIDDFKYFHPELNTKFVKVDLDRIITVEEEN